MPGDYEDLYDIENMSDDELRQLVLDELLGYPDVDVDYIEVSVRNGAVTLSGRVGTEQDLQRAEAVVTDVLGIENITNELVVDELVRAELDEAADDAHAQELETALSAGARTSDEASHLMENLDAEQFGTGDPQEAIERGTSYEPPDTPPQVGTSRENH